ncbi:MAG TPA: hypothetical protein VFX16_16560 [Pseudonocardiaceae bacterium]|nr:hypothetical protein [Pseudonocardiaceae bacterium]
MSPPPGYLVHRRVLIGVIVGVLVLAGLVLALHVPAVASWVGAATTSLHRTWLSWNWHLL